MPSPKLLARGSNWRRKRKKDLKDAKQKGYEFYFEEQLASVQKIQGKLFQASYNHGLDAAIIPSASSLRTFISIPLDFKYVSERDEGEAEE